MPSRVACWLHGHRWGEWDHRVWKNLLGERFRIRRCEQCGARDRKAA